jgi:CheY-like chemotaxis protein
MKVLVVDDDDDVRRITALSLSAVGGFATVEARNGREGVEVALREQPDLILLDVMMPGMDGPQTLGALRRQALTAGIPVVFLTAKAMQSEIDRLEQLDVCGVLSKPFDPVTLPLRVQELWRQVSPAPDPAAESSPTRPCS